MASPRESKEPGVYEWTLALVHPSFLTGWLLEQDPPKQPARRGREEFADVISVTLADQ